MKISRLTILLLAVVSLMLTSCKESDDMISRRYPCRFHFYQQMHPTSMIWAAYRSPGTYVFVYTQVETSKGVSYRYVYVQS